MAASKLGTRTITQVGIVVRDIETKAEAYARLLGVDVPEIITTAPEQEAHTRFRGASCPARARLAFFDTGAVQLELIEPVDGPSTWREFLDRKGEGVHHIAFQVTDTDAVTQRLEQVDIPVIQQGDYAGGRYTYVDGEQSLGLVIELLENLD